MKRTVLLITTFLLSLTLLNAQILKSISDKLAGSGKLGSGLSSDEIANGLKRSRKAVQLRAGNKRISLRVTA